MSKTTLLRAFWLCGDTNYPHTHLAQTPASHTRARTKDSRLICAHHTCSRPARLRQAQCHTSPAALWCSIVRVVASLHEAHSSSHHARARIRRSCRSQSSAESALGTTFAMALTSSGMVTCWHGVQCAARESRAATPLGVAAVACAGVGADSGLAGSRGEVVIACWDAGERTPSARACSRGPTCTGDVRPVAAAACHPASCLPVPQARATSKTESR